MSARIEVDRLDDPDRPDLPEWRLEARVPRGRDPRVVQAGPDGRFDVGSLGAGQYLVRALDAHGATAGVVVEVPGDGARLEANINIPSGPHSIKGLARDSDGRPVRGTVSLLPFAPLESDRSFFEPPASKPLDAEGRFEFPGLSAGRAWIGLHQDRLLIAALSVGIAGDEEVAIDLPPRAHPVVGGVRREDGTPLPGARVWLVGGSDDLQTITRARADATGAFRADHGFPSGTVWAASEGLEIGRAEIGADGHVEVRLARASEARIRGRARTPDGKPIEGVVVAALNPPNLRDGPVCPAPPQGSARTDADGHFDIGLRDEEGGGYSIVAAGRGWISESLRTPRGPRLLLEVGKGESVTHDVTLVPAASVSGTAVDEHGLPVTGAVVVARPFELPFDDVAVTRADGSFTLRGLVPGASYWVWASAPDRVPARAELGVAGTGRLEPERLVLESAWWATVEVVDAERGLPVEGQPVGIAPAVEGREGIPTSLGLGLGAATGEDGTFRLGPLPRSRAMHVNVTLHGFVDEFQEPRVVQVPESGDAVVRYRVRRGKSISGRVETEDGSPVARASVHARGTWPEAEGAGGNAFGTTGEDGRFRLDGLPDGKYFVGARLYRGGRERTLERDVHAVAGEENVLIRLVGATAADARRLVVRVLDGDGAPVDGGYVALESGWIQPIAGGRVVVGPGSGPLPGRVTRIEVRAPEKGPEDFRWGGIAEVPVPEGATDVEVRLPFEKRIEGAVVDAAGKPVRGVQITLRAAAPLSGRDWDGHGSARTGPDGRFSIGRLWDGDFRVEIRPPPPLPAPSPPTVRSGGPPLQVRLEGGVAVRVTVVDPDGKAVPNARVLVRTPREGSEIGDDIRTVVVADLSTDAEGMAVVGGLLAAREYVLLVSTALVGTPKFFPYEAAKWRPADTTVRLERVYAIAGAVRAPSGRPVGGVTVWMHVAGTREAGNWGPQHVQDDGAFRFEGLKAGEYELKVTDRDDWEGLDGHNAAWIPVKAGRTDVALTFDPGRDVAVRISDPPSGIEGAEVTFIREDRNGGGTRSARIDAGGRARVTRVAAGVPYTVWVGPVGDLSVLKTGFRAADTELVLTLSKGSSIRGRIVLPEGWFPESVELEDPTLPVKGTVSPDGTFEIRGLQTGTYRLRGGARYADGTRYEYVETVAGGSVDIVFREPKR